MPAFAGMTGYGGPDGADHEDDCDAAGIVFRITWSAGDIASLVSTTGLEPVTQTIGMTDCGSGSLDGRVKPGHGGWGN